MSFLQTKLMPLAKELAKKVLTALQGGWSTYRSFPKRAQVGIAVVLVALLFGGHYLLGLLTPADATGSTTPTVSLMSIGELSGTGSSIGIVGSVRSVTEASILSESGGTVKAISTSVGKTVGAGSVLASLDNASQRASVLQAEGAYEAALAARQGVSPTDVAGSARNTDRKSVV